MRYYEIKADAVAGNAGEYGEEENESEILFRRRRADRERSAEIGVKAERFNRRFDGNTEIFVADIKKRQIIMGAITREDELCMQAVREFINAIEYPADPASVSMEEVVLSDVCSLMERADTMDYIADKDNYLENFDLSRLYHNGFRRNMFGEDLITETGKDELLKKADECMSDETLIPELKRIYQPSKLKMIKGHPVHYLIETDNTEIRKNVCSTLLSALHDSGRVKNLRYSYTNLDPAEGINGSFLDDLYKSAAGGSLIIHIPSDTGEEDSRYASVMMSGVEAVCEQMYACHNDVLTVICMPRECKKIKNVIYENLFGTGLVEIKEDLADREKSEKYLRLLAKKNGIRPDKKLFSMLNEEKTYLSTELRDIFGTWYDRKLKDTYYPQYKEIVTSAKKCAAEQKKGNAYRELNEMTGLSGAKEVINKAIDYYKAQKLFKLMGINEENPAMHMIFTGNPGSAKTTVARLFADIMKDNGILSTGQLVEVGRSDLVGKYVGWTAVQVKKCFKEAKGGVLFIDEAYSLVDDRDGMFGDEAINTIVQEMENHRDDMVVIFAGYPDKMEDFLSKNPGLRSRIAFHVPFNDYSTDELCEIAENMGKKKGIRFTADAASKLRDLFEEARLDPEFGNGRYVRNVLEKTRMNQASRLIKKNLDDLTAEDFMVIEAEDITVPAVSKRKEERTIGFAT